MLTLTIEKRNELGKKAKKLHGEGKLPAVLYGKKEKALPIALNFLAFEKVWKQAGMNTVIALEGAGAVKEALIHDVDVDPVRDIPRHVDFYVIEKGQKVQVNVPIEFIGVSPAVKELGGVLVKVMHELEVEAEPARLPQHIIVDLSSLVDFESQIVVGDITVPEGVMLLAGPEEVIVLVSEVTEEAEEPALAPDLSTIEVEKKGKQETAEGESAAEAAQ